MLFVPTSTADVNNDATCLRQPHVRPVKVIRAHSLAHLEIGTGERTELAREWTNGRSIVVPTAKVAAEVFGVSERHIRRAERHSSTSLALGMLAAGWLKSTEAERAAFVDKYSASIWDVIDSVTAPPAIPAAPPAKSNDNLKRLLQAQDERWRDDMEG